jgi:hypothetical protein
MKLSHVLTVACLAIGLTNVPHAQQGAPAGGPGRGGAPAGQAPGGRGVGGGRGAAGGAPIGGTLTPAKADERGWGWAVKASINPATPRPFYNKA